MIMRIAQDKTSILQSKISSISIEKLRTLARVNIDLEVRQPLDVYKQN